MALDLGKAVSVLVRQGSERVLLVGRLTHLSGSSSVLACTEAASEGITQRVKVTPKGADALAAAASGGELEPIFFIRVAMQSLRPISEEQVGDYSLVPIDTAFASCYANAPTVQSSDSELQTAAEDSSTALRAEIRELRAALARQSRPPGGATSSRAAGSESAVNPFLAAMTWASSRRGGLFANVDQFWKPAEGEDEDDDDELDEMGSPDLPESAQAPRHQSMGWNPPGGGTTVAPKSQARKPRVDSKMDFEQMAMASLAQGGSLDDTLKMLMMSQLLGRRRRSAATSSNEGSDEEDELGLADHSTKKKSGLKAAREMQELKDRITKEPLRLVREFERTARDDLGVVDGMAWTLRDWVEKQSWGKFKSLQRAAHQDVAVYQFLRQNQPKAALAQLVQNLKSKAQAALDSGDWGMAWLLCGLPDPLKRREFIGTESEMAIIAGYEKSLIEVRKKQEEARAALRVGDKAEKEG
eukprot:TRINITY_DN8694_c0_g2_i2.p1 TRINITY_DN8694_c0_g2~~TRINITY_DN8694_c0_g2_i2.p1  ORF type:complete len:471 (-),score=76.52 TRINITY_DN8694_c0_g2_i2:634-2046(-)